MNTAKVFDLARQGDGLITVNGKKVFIPNTAAGDTVEYRMVSDTRAEVVQVLESSADRAVPLCPYAAECGGCALQQLGADAYRAFKLRCLREALAGLELPEFDEPVFVAPKTRRRVTFAVVWNGLFRGLGLNQRQSEKILPVDSCAVLIPELERLIKPLRAAVTDKKLPYPKKRGSGDVSLLWTDTGADVLLTLPFSPDAAWRKALADFAVENGVARVSWRISERQEAEPLIILHRPELKIGDFTLNPPAGVFLQPSEAGQDALTAAVVEYVGKAKKVYDLFCGAGTFTLPLLQKKRILKGADNAPFALEALRLASQGRVEVQERDLFKTPLYPDELEGFDCVVFDPPRAGAKAQVEQIAAAGIPKVVAVSCNPVSFARDAEILINSGYTLKRLRPVDQFVFTPHLELAALFEK